MLTSNIKARDFEILRTLLRVQFATSRSLQRVFFSDMSWARKRLAALRYRYGLIAPHTKGLPGAHVAAGGQFWCLTQAGIEAVLARYPETRVPEDHYRRCGRASLRNFEHRSACAELYLGLIECKSRDLALISARADEISWYFDKDVRLSYMSVEGASYKPKAVLPDATLITGHARIFLELDRSTERSKVCQAALNAYRNAVEATDYVEALPGPTATVVVYVTQTEARAKNLRALIERMGPLPFRALAMESRQAAEWLSRAVTEDPGDGQPLPTFDDCLGQLRALYSACCYEFEARDVAPQTTELAPALQATYALFERIEKAS